MDIGVFALIALLMSFGIAVIGSSAGYAHKNLMTQANYYAAATQPQAVAVMRDQLATAVQTYQNTTTVSAPATYGPIAACNSTQASCPFKTTTTFAIAGNANGSGGSGNVTGSLTESQYIQANNVNILATTKITDGGGAIVSTLTRNVTVTLSLTSPFAFIAASTDVTGGASGPRAGGDMMNCYGANATTCDTGATAAADDTRIHAFQRCQANAGSGTCSTDQDVTNSYSQQKTWNQGTSSGNTWAH